MIFESVLLELAYTSASLGYVSPSRERVRRLLAEGEAIAMDEG
jgi:hypothetical protein